jgi:hypothetical protein
MQVWPRDLICLSHAGISVAAGGVVTVGGLRYFPWNERVRERPGMFSRPPDVDRDRRRADLINRARLVRAHGWDDYRVVWSSGEVVGVAALLGDHDILEELDEPANGVGPLGVRFVGPGRRTSGCRRQLQTIPPVVHRHSAHTVNDVSADSSPPGASPARAGRPSRLGAETERAVCV